MRGEILCIIERVRAHSNGAHYRGDTLDDGRSCKVSQILQAERGACVTTHSSVVCLDLPGDAT